MSRQTFEAPWGEFRETQLRELLARTRPSCANAWPCCIGRSRQPSPRYHERWTTAISCRIQRPWERASIEVINADGTHRVIDVSLGLFDVADGLVQITGSDLETGQQIVNPAL